jgi:uncharacterized protein (TIGR03067 family)
MRAVFGIVMLVMGVLAIAQEPKKPAHPEEFQKLQGTWILESWETAGEELSTANLKKRAAFIGANMLILRKEGKILHAGLMQIDPTKSPARLDLAIKEGVGKDTIMLGIYELDGDTLKICLDTEGEARPKEFVSKVKTNHQLITLKKPKRPDDQTIEIVGTYRSDVLEPDGKRATSEAKIERRGDGYLITYLNGPKVLYLGTGIRKGNTMSMVWTNGPAAGVSVYKIEAGPKLTGEYTNLGGLGMISTETLTRQKRTERISTPAAPDLK